MDFLSKLVANAIVFLSSLMSSFWQSLIYSNLTWWQATLDILLVALFFYFVFILIKGSRAVNILFGIILVGLVFVLSKSFQLLALGWLLDRILTVVLVAIPVIFQQELRMALEKLGHTPSFTLEKNLMVDAMIAAIVESAEFLAKGKQGALIVIEGTVPLKEYIETGVKLDSAVSKELLISIFGAKGPLHDGAVIIQNDKVAAAACVLPTSFATTDKNIGTRHKAAIGLAEHTDANIIVISEEKGTISFAKSGKLEKNIELSRLQHLLRNIMRPPSSKKFRQLKYKES